MAYIAAYVDIIRRLAFQPLDDQLGRLDVAGFRFRKQCFGY